VLDGADIGWLQTAIQADSFFLGQLYIVRSSQRKGVGTEIMGRLLAEAAQAKLPLRLDVAKINPALRLDRRLGFCVTGEEEHKFNMTWTPTIQSCNT
jgi:GNAT superfamily N-acetyltransferase